MVLEAFASYLGDLFAQAAHDELGMLLGVPGEIARMGDKLGDLNNFLADADRRNVTDKRVQVWVGELKRAMYEASDILDLCRLKAIEQGRPSTVDLGCFNPLLFCLRNPLHAHDIGTRIKVLNQRLDAIKERSAAFRFINLGSYEDRGSRVAPSAIRERETSSGLDLSGLVGEKIEEDTNKLVEIMLREMKDKNNENNNNFKVIAIVGVGGIGKTTLAQKVFNDEDIQNEFDTKIWLSVNKDFDKAELLRTAITHAKGDHRDGKSKAVLQPILTEALTGKKVLMVMDDVWNQRAWEDVLKLPLVKAAPGSRVLITTRHESVAHNMSAMRPYHHIATLTSEDAWSLLKKQALFLSDMNESDIDTLKEIGLQIIEKCGCLPLAVKVMGGLLRNKEKLDWEQVLGDSLWSISEMPQELNSAVHLSYEDLPPRLKQCFLYCSLLPKSRSFHVNMVVAMWIGEGFIEGKSDDLEKEGTDYYKELISRNLMEQNKWWAGDNWYCSMHDIIRSFAQYVARAEALISHNGETDISNMLNSQKFLRLSIVTEGWQSGELEWRSIQDQFSVRTLISVGQINMKPGDSLVTFSSLRTVHIQSTNVAALLDSLHRLKHLRYLALENTDISALPRKIGKMKLLQHIYLTDCKSLVELPDSIVKLVHLRYLCLNDTINVDIPKGFGGLTNMRRLSGFRAHMDGDWCSLEELGPLSQLRLIGVVQLENVSTASSAAKANLGEKKHLTDMSLSCTSRSWDDVPEEEQRHIENVYDKLRPPPSVKWLNIYGYFGQRLPGG